MHNVIYTTDGNRVIKVVDNHVTSIHKICADEYSAQRLAERLNKKLRKEGKKDQ